VKAQTEGFDYVHVLPNFDSKNDVKAWFLYDFNITGPLDKNQILAIPHETKGFLVSLKTGTSVLLIFNRIFTPRAKWIDSAKKYCSMYSWGSLEQIRQVMYQNKRRDSFWKVASHWIHG
jgi:hypothetical protein